MSNIYNSDNRPVYSYTPLDKLTEFNCNQGCLCRETSERSQKDQMYYDWYILGKPIVTQPNGVVVNPGNPFSLHMNFTPK